MWEEDKIIQKYIYIPVIYIEINKNKSKNNMEAQYYSVFNSF